jgi:amino acid transporter
MPDAAGNGPSILDFLIGKPLASSEERRECIGVSAGIPVFGLDALSSAAYGPEAALTLLIPLGVLGDRYVVPITLAIILLLTILYFSYRQTIAAYPNGGGSYIVASENLGPFAGLVAGAALLLDYTLVVAVGISAGVGALVSAVPQLQAHTLAICLVLLVFITLVNLRGVREAGAFFMLPTYLFLGCLLWTIFEGAFKTVLAGGHPVPIATLPVAAGATVTTAGAWLVLQTFANGCTAMTGVEAVSNGVRAFREPVVQNAQRTLTVVIGLLIVLLGGIAYLARVYHIVATDPGAPGYQSVLSLLVGAVVGRNWFYFLSMAAILAILALSANTAFADFPRVCRAIAVDNCLPHFFAYRGRRLVYTEGIVALAAVSAALLILFGGVTDRLIPLFAIGAFLAFTLSQAGMVLHWKRVGGKGARRSMAINGLGALATGVTLVVVLVAKFTAGAWVSTLLIAGMIALMLWVRRNYRLTAAQICDCAPVDPKSVEPPIVVVPIPEWNTVTDCAMRFALGLSSDIRAIHVATEDEHCVLEEQWHSLVETPLLEAGRTPPKLVMLDSPYRMVLNPIVEYVQQVAQEHPGRQVAVVVPELVQRRWYQHFLYNERAELLKALLLLKGDKRIVLINVPWYLRV